MSLIIRPPWTQQPQQAVEIDRTNAFGSRCDFSWLASLNANGVPKIAASAGLAANFSTQIGYGKANAVAARPFTVVLVMAFPAPSVGSGYGIYVGSGNGFRLDTFTTGGGIYAAWTANGVGNGDNTFRDGSGVFDMRPVVLVSDWTSTGQTSWWQRQGMAPVSWSDSFGYNGPSDTTVYLGQNGAGAGRMFAAAILRGNVGEAGARLLLQNPWQIFKPQPRRIWTASAGGAVDGTGSGLLAQSNLSPVLGTGSSTSDATGIGTLDDLSLQAILASASSSVTGSGLLSSLSLSSVSGSAQVSAQAVSALASIILTAISGSASTTGAGTATGALPLLSLSSLGALAAGSGNANASFDDLSLNAPQATAFTGAVGSGDLAGISLSSPSVIASGNALTTAALRAISLGVVNASATSGAPQILTQADIDAIVTALLTDPRLLTVAKFLALK